MSDIFMDGVVKELNVRVVGRGVALRTRGVECPWERNMFVFSDLKFNRLNGYFGEVWWGRKL